MIGAFQDSFNCEDTARSALLQLWPDIFGVFGSVSLLLYAISADAQSRGIIGRLAGA